jgi:Tol biopolymer transport system component/DNA-binding winged helix-turn-helix (wHTH) protein
VDLTAIEPFRLASFEVTPARGEIVHGGTLARLEPKVMAVLVVLARSPGETVSREKLLEDVWEGRAVTDDALTRCISALRRVFRDGEGVEIKALPKLGYRLAVDMPVTRPAKRPTANLRAAISPTIVVTAAAVALTLGAAAVLSFRAPPTPERTEARVTPLTSLPGREYYPALSPAGGQLAFVHGGANGQWDLFVQSLAGGEPQRLTNDAAREQHPVWSASGGELVFVRRDGDTCEIVRLAVPGGAPRPIGSCGAQFVHSLDWSHDGKLLALTRTNERLAPAELVFLALEGDAPAPVVDPKRGAEDARFSPDGRALALTLSTAIGAEDVYTLDLSSGALARLTRDNAKIHGLDWSSDGRSIVYGSNRVGSFGLHRVALAGGAPISLLPSLQDIENPAVAGHRIAYEVWTETGALKSLPEGAALPPESTRLEWHPDVAPDGAMTFVSDRSGAPEVWLWEQGRAGQLTFFGDAYIHTPKFSPDGKRIAFAAPRDGHFNLFLTDRTGKQTRLTQGAANDMSPAWSPDGRSLYFASDRDGAWRPWKIDLDSAKTERVSSTLARAVYVLNSRELLTVDPIEGGLFRVDRDNPDMRRPLAKGTAPSDWANIAVTKTGVLYVRREPPDRAVLRRLDPATGRDVKVADLEDFYFRSGLAVMADGTIVYATVDVEDVSLMLFEEGRLTAELKTDGRR